MSAPLPQPGLITGWTPHMPRALKQLLIDATRYDHLADTAGGSQRRKYFRRKTKAMVQAHSRYPDWFYPPRREGGCIALYPKTGWPSRNGVRASMHIPVATILANAYYRKRYHRVVQGDQPRRPKCARDAKPWPRRLCPQNPRRRRQSYRNRPPAPSAVPA